MNLTSHHENLSLICDKLNMLSTTILHAAHEFNEAGWSGFSRMIDEIAEDLQPTVDYLGDKGV